MTKHSWVKPTEQQGLVQLQRYHPTVMPRGWKRNENSVSRKSRRGGQSHQSYGQSPWAHRERSEQWNPVNCSREGVRSAAIYIDTTPQLERGYSDVSEHMGGDADDITLSEHLDTEYPLEAFIKSTQPNAKSTRRVKLQDASQEPEPQKLTIDASEQPRHLLPNTVEFAITFLTKEGLTQWHGGPGTFPQMHWNMDELILCSVPLASQLHMALSCKRFAGVFRERILPELLAQLAGPETLNLEFEFEYNEPASRQKCNNCGEFQRLCCYSGMHCASCFSCTNTWCKDLENLRNNQLSMLGKPIRWTLWNSSSVNYYEQTGVCPLCDRCRNCNSTQDVCFYGWKSTAAWDRVQYFDILCSKCARIAWKHPEQYKLGPETFKHIVHAGLQRQKFMKSIDNHYRHCPYMQARWADAIDNFRIQ